MRLCRNVWQIISPYRMRRGVLVLIPTLHRSVTGVSCLAQPLLQAAQLSDATNLIHRDGGWSNGRRRLIRRNCNRLYITGYLYVR
jgi:hypothetical protein